MSQTSCPRCHKQVENLIGVDNALREKLAAGGSNEPLPAQICENCYADIAKSLGRGGLLMAREKAKEQNRLMLWKNRVGLIKAARTAMGEKMFPEAAVNYEKYIRTLEIVFDVKPGELTPELFKDSARTSELTVIASVYWDLLRIYDTSDSYAERQAKAAQQLATFIRFTPIFPDIIRKAESFAKSAKNPGIFKSFLKMSNEQRPRCFIASSAFEYPMAPEILYLQSWRDLVLSQNKIGQQFIRSYYKFSPSIACFLDKHPTLKPLVRVGLRCMIFCVKIIRSFYTCKGH